MSARSLPAMTTLPRAVLLIGSLLWAVGGCGSETDASGGDGATLTVSVAALLGDDAPAGVQSLQVKLFEGPIDDPAAPAAFDTGCIPFQGDTLRLFNQAPGEGYALLVDLFADGQCTDLRHRGLRGEIVIAKDGNEQNPYVVPVASVDAFRRLPGLAGSPPTGHFPLGPWRVRAFHTATAIGDGQVVIVGGAESVNGDQVIGGDGWPVVFDSRAMLFRRVTGGPLAGQRIMAHAATALPDGRVVVAGGVEALRVGIADATGGRALAFDVPPTICYTDACNTPNFVERISLVDPSTGGVDQIPLATARVFATLNVVQRAAGLTMVLAGGVPGSDQYDDYDAFACVYATNGSVSCDPLVLVAKRAGHAAACYRTDGQGTCTSLALIAGVTPNLPFAEYVGGDVAEFTAANLGNAPTTERLLLPGAAGAEGVIFVTGGVLGDRLSAGELAGGASVTITPSGAGDYTSFAGSAELPASAGRLLFHTVTTLGQGRVLVAGGLTDDLQPTARAFILRADGAEFVVERVLSLTTPRFGHSATRIEGGPLDGAVLVTGGLTIESESAEGKVTFGFVDTAEILLPSHALD